jgi:hypothetical protein
MTALNWLFVRAFDVLLTPLAALPRILSLALVALATAVAMLLAFRTTSDQRRLTSVKRSIHAGFFEIRLFADDVPTLLRAQLEMLRHTVTYLRLSLVPALWMILPLTLIVSHLEFHFGYGGLTPGTSALVTATFRGGAAPDSGTPGGQSERELSENPGAILDPSPSIRIDTPAVWFPGAREVVWRITPKSNGEYELRVRLGDEVFIKTLQVSDGVVRRSPIRQAGSVLDQLLYPSEAPLPNDGALTAIAVQYPRREIRILGWDTDWLIAYVALIMIFMIALRRPFGVVL